MESKILDLKENGFNNMEIVENIFLNYSSVYDNDTIYKLKKDISLRLKTDIINIRLIGSAHLGIKKNDETETLELVDNPSDYDFAIIDSKVFAFILNDISQKNLVTSQNKPIFCEHLSRGKLHLRYIKKPNIISEICTEIESKNMLKKNVSICIYLNEEFFINNLKVYFNNMFDNYYKKYKEIKIKKVKKFK